MVPSWATTSSRFMPTPESVTDTVAELGSNSTSMDIDSAPSAGSASARNRRLSQASEALEISSRRKISRFE